MVGIRYFTTDGADDLEARVRKRSAGFVQNLTSALPQWTWRDDSDAFADRADR